MDRRTFTANNALSASGATPDATPPDPVFASLEAYEAACERALSLPGDAPRGELSRRLEDEAGAALQAVCDTDPPTFD